MYESFYGLREKPFNLTPDPRFLYLSNKHKEAFAHLLYGIHNRCGFVMVSGEIGTGKTTICRSLLSQLDPDTEVAFIFNPFLSPQELLRKVNEDFGIASKAHTVKGLIDELNDYLLRQAAQKKNCVIVIDEAQNLDVAVLEQVRLLSNLETERQKLLQIVLIGQPELRDKLALPELRQLNQRITARYHLEPLNESETLQYIAFRLRVASGRPKVRFTQKAIKSVYRISGGTPRVINALCDRALLFGYTREVREISAEIVREAAKEVQGEYTRRRAPQAFSTSVARGVLGTAAIGLLIAVIVMLNPQGPAFEAVADWNGEGSAPVTDLGSGSGPRIVNASITAGPPSATSEETSRQKESESAVALEAGGVAARLQPEHDRVTEPEPVELIESPAIRSAYADLNPADAMDAALRTTLRQWNRAVIGEVPTRGGIQVIRDFARVNGLSSTLLSSPLDELLSINLPALIQLAPEREPLWCALVGVRGDKLAVTAGQDESALIPREELDNWYTGTAIVCWHDPAPSQAPLRSTSRGETVAALQRQLRALDLWDGEPHGVYNLRTEQAVRTVQETTGLAVDGVAGPQTRMVLTSWSQDYTTPALFEDKYPDFVRNRLEMEKRAAESRSGTVASEPDVNTTARLDTLELFRETDARSAAASARENGTQRGGAPGVAVFDTPLNLELR